MTTHNSLQQYNDLSRAYKNALGLEDGGLERAGETLTPTFPLFELPEYAVQRGELLGVATIYQAGVAAQFSGIGVGVAANDHKLLVVEPDSRCVVESGGIAIYNVRGMLATDMVTQLVNAGVVYGTDSRRWNGGGAMLNAPIPMLFQYGATAAPAGDLIAACYTNNTVPAAETLASIGPIVISPGYAVAVWAWQVNTGLRVNFRLRVRALQRGEDSA